MPLVRFFTAGENRYVLIFKYAFWGHCCHLYHTKAHPFYVAKPAFLRGLFVVCAFSIVEDVYNKWYFIVRFHIAPAIRGNARKMHGVRQAG